MMPGWEWQIYGLEVAGRDGVRAGHDRRSSPWDQGPDSRVASSHDRLLSYDLWELRQQTVNYIRMLSPCHIGDIMPLGDNGGDEYGREIHQHGINHRPCLGLYTSGTAVFGDNHCCLILMHTILVLRITSLHCYTYPQTFRQNPTGTKNVTDFSWA